MGHIEKNQRLQVRQKLEGFLVGKLTRYMKKTDYFGYTYGGEKVSIGIFVF